MKIIAVCDFAYAFEVDDHNVIIADSHLKRRTGLVWKERISKLD